MSNGNERVPSIGPEQIRVRDSLADNLGYLLAQCWLDEGRININIDDEVSTSDTGGDVDRRDPSHRQSNRANWTEF